MRLLAADTSRAMRTINTPGRPFDLGLGWFRRPADQRAQPGFVEYWGTGGGFWNAMRLYPDQGLGLVVMANTTRAYDHHALITALISAFPEVVTPASGSTLTSRWRSIGP